MAGRTPPDDGEAGNGPHAGGLLATAGPDVVEADRAVVLLHGRGATAYSILGLLDDVGVTDVAALAPQANGNTWYPYSFMAPMSDNEPHLSSALARVDEAVRVATDAGIPRERVAVLGFSQGACLGTEYVARNATRYGAVVALSGGLIGPEGTRREYDGSLDGTPTFVGCSDSDPHIPLERVHETTAVYESLGAVVDERIYEGMGHGINEDELGAVADLLADL